MCRERIDRQAPPAERGNLLAAPRVMAEMRYYDPQLLGLLGGQIIIVVLQQTSTARAIAEDHQQVGADFG